ncbi:MAG: HIT domain-containing protein [Anaerolineae bacterium]
MRSELNKLLFRLARSDIAGYFIGLSFHYLSFLIPVTKVVSNEWVLSFDHPKPFWEQHFLIVPKRRISTLMSLDLQQPADQELVQAILLAAKETASLVGMQGYTVVVNGESYQDVPQLHFHVAAGKDENGKLESNKRPEFGELSNVSNSTNFWAVHADEVVDNRFRKVFTGRETFDLEDGAAEICDLFCLIHDSVSKVKFAGFSVRIIPSEHELEESMIAILAGELIL